ncbi:MAG: alpha/beta hydrolase [Myxococcales bacterium]|nr:alpha/beta hydrolase [Myxococcales bacterium]
MRRMRAMLIAVGAIAAVVAVLVFLAWLWQRRLIYFPLREPPTSAAARFPGGEDVRYTTNDGLTLGAWFVRPAGHSTGATVIIFGGNGGHRGYRAPLVDAFAAAGYAVLMVDYRGYGENPGEPTEAGLLADARAARAYLLARPDIDPDRLVYFGESLGAAVAVALSGEHPPAALVLRSPFASLADMAQVHYPFLPASWLLRDRYPTLERIVRLGVPEAGTAPRAPTGDRTVRVAVPLLVIAGERDQIVPSEQSRQVYEAAPGPKAWVAVPDADHNDLALAAGDAILAHMFAFLRDALGPP